MNAVFSFASVLIRLLEITKFFPFFLYSLPSLLCLNTEFSEHLQYPQMGIHHISTILPGPGFNRAFIQSDQVWPDQELWNRFLCEPLWDGFLGLDFCGNVPSGNTATSFTSFPSLGSPLETKVCYHFCSSTVCTKLIFGERKWGVFLWTTEDKCFWYHGVPKLIQTTEKTHVVVSPWILIRIEHHVLRDYNQEKKSYAECSNDQFAMHHVLSSSLLGVIAQLMAWTALQQMLM